MISVIIENTVRVHNRDVTSNSKIYQFNDVKTAENFVDKLYDINQGGDADNIVRASILDYSFEPSTDTVPLILHTVYYDHTEKPQDGLRFLEDIDVLTVEEIESFRAQGIKPGIVFAYDNPGSIEPSVGEELPERSSRFDVLGADLFDHDPDTTFHLSFNPEIGNLLLAKYGHESKVANVVK